MRKFPITEIRTTEIIDNRGMPTIRAYAYALMIGSGDRPMYPAVLQQALLKPAMSGMQRQDIAGKGSGKRSRTSILKFSRRSKDRMPLANEKLTFA